MKKVSLLLLIAVAIVCLVGVQSANAADLSVTVTVLGTAGFTLTPASWAIGSVSPGAVVAMDGVAPPTGKGGPILIDNTGTLTQTFSLGVTAPGAWTSGGLINEVAHNKFVLATRLLGTGVAAPLAAAYVNTDVLYSSTRACNGTDFGGGGQNVDPGTDLNMWLLFKAPTSTSTATQQTITVNVTSQ